MSNEITGNHEPEENAMFAKVIAQILRSGRVQGDKHREIRLSLGISELFVSLHRHLASCGITAGSLSTC